MSENIITGIGKGAGKGPEGKQTIAFSTDTKSICWDHGGHPEERLEKHIEEAEATIDRLKEFIEAQISQGAWGGHALDAYMKEYKEALEGKRQ